jgi:RNA polymerase sigma factor (sigma-70 family)
MQPQPNPSELLAAVRCGDTRALDSLYRSWSSRVRLFARLQLAPSGFDAEALADEITIDVFHELWRAPERFDGRVAFNTWLFTLARNKAIDRLRQLQRRQRWEDSTALDGFDPPADALHEPPAQLARQQRQHGVMDCLRRLRNPLQRESLMLWALEDMPLAHIAQLQNSPENTVKTRLYHGRLNLRACLERWLAREGNPDAY